MKIYRIKHLPSGFYFCPVRKIRVTANKHNAKNYVKSNLSQNGKVYHKKPSLDWCSKIYVHFGDQVQFVRWNNNSSVYAEDTLIITLPEDWEIQEFDI